MVRVEFYEEKSTDSVIVPLSRQERPWRWRVIAGNGEIVSSGESFESRSNAKRGFRTAVRVMTLAEALLDRPEGSDEE